MQVAFAGHPASAQHEAFAAKLVASQAKLFGIVSLSQEHPLLVTEQLTPSAADPPAPVPSDASDPSAPPDDGIELLPLEQPTRFANSATPQTPRFMV